MLYCKIINIICKIEENLKENNQTPQHSKTSLWGPKAEIPSAPPTSQSPSRNRYPKKKIETPEKETISCSQFTAKEHQDETLVLCP